MTKTVVYAGTRNVYPCMAAAAKSLLRHTAVDRVYFLIEDDSFPETLPDVIQCVNVSGQDLFNPAGPNYGSRWTYMTLMRLALPYVIPFILPERVLYLDIDTIVTGDISEVFDLDMGGYAMAAVREPGRCKNPFVYYNTGVLLIDLPAMGAHGIADDLINMVNRRKLDFPDQDAVNLRCQGRIKEISPIYNSCPWTSQPLDAKIIHFAADKDYAQRSLFQEYMRMDWSEISAGKE